eukprot:5176981-Alexandrium_andersonii.AAC.1
MLGAGPTGRGRSGDLRHAALARSLPWGLLFWGRCHTRVARRFAHSLQVCATPRSCAALWALLA